TNFAYRWHERSGHQHLPNAVAQPAVIAIGIAYPDNGDGSSASKTALPTVTHGVVIGYLADLRDGGDQAGNRFQQMTVECAGTVQSDSQPHHIESGFRPAFDTSRIGDVCKKRI